MQRRQRTIEAVARARKHDWKIAVPTGAIALVALIVGSTLGNVHGPGLRERVAVWVSAAVLAVFGVIATRRAAAGLGQLIARAACRPAGQRCGWSPQAWGT